MPNLLEVVKLAAREARSTPRVVRTPEPWGAMTELDRVAAYHAQGGSGGSMLSLYRLNALAISRLLPRGGVVVDLGSGSGQFLCVLARHRPDARIIGLDMSEPMVATGRALIAEHGLAARIELRVGDMTRFAESVPGEVDLVSSIFSMHHLPTFDAVRACIAEVARVRERSGCAAWVFDHARPRTPETLRDFAAVFTPEAPAAFREDSTNSLAASWSFEELGEALRAGLAADVHGVLSRFVRLYQAFWVPPRGRSADMGRGEWCEPERPSRRTLSEFRMLSLMLRGLPLDHPRP